MEAMENRNDAMEQIVTYIKKLKFKKALVGGIDQEHAYQCMRELVSMFTKVYSAEVDRARYLEAQLRDAERNRDAVKAQMQSLKTQVAQRMEKARAESDAREQKLSADNATLQEQLEAAKQNQQAAEVALNAQIAALNAQVAAREEEQKHLTGEIEQLRSSLAENTFQRETLEDIYLDANRKRREILSAAERDAEEMKRSAFEEAVAEQDRFQQEWAAREAELDRREQALSDREIELENRCDVMTAEAQAESDRVRKDAEMHSSNMIAEAKALAAATVEEAELKSDRMVAEAQAESDRLLAEARSESERVTAEAQAESERVTAEAQAESRRVTAEAQAEKERMAAEAEALVASAQDTYKAERARYDAMVRRLSDARNDVLRGIQKDVSMLQSLAFRMSGTGLETDEETVSD